METPVGTHCRGSLIRVFSTRFNQENRIRSKIRKGNQCRRFRKGEMRPRSPALPSLNSEYEIECFIMHYLNFLLFALLTFYNALIHAQDWPQWGGSELKQRPRLESLAISEPQFGNSWPQKIVANVTSSCLGLDPNSQHRTETRYLISSSISSGVDTVRAISSRTSSRYLLRKRLNATRTAPSLIPS
jgi:hypothetical protein